MEWLLPENDGSIVRPTTGSPIRSSRGARRAISTLRGGGKKDSLPCSMILLEAAADVVRSSTCLRRERLTPRGGVKRPRTTSSTSSMLSMSSTTPAVAMTKIETWHEKGKKSNKAKQQRPFMFRSRGAHHPGGWEQDHPSLLSSTVHTERAIRGSAAAANKRGCIAASSYSNATDGADEAEAMAADEAVISLPPSPPPMHALRASRPGLPTKSPSSVDKQTPETTQTLPKSLDVGPCGMVSSVCGSAARHHVVGEHFIFQSNKSDAAVAGEGAIDSKEGDSAKVVRMESEPCLPKEGTSSRSPDAARHNIKPDDRQVDEGGQRSGRGVVNSGWRRQLPLEGAAREHFLTTMTRSDDACQSVREDLVRYMEGVRANVGEDGTPLVTFPRNFDRVVGLMGRHELGEPPQLEREETSKNGAAGGGGNAEQEKTQDAPPPWTKYLLEEGLDRTKAFSRYRGMFADEQTGEDRVMHGLAKMRELDLRLARTTQRARELRRMARDAAEEAERAAGMDLTQSCEPLPDHPRGRGPVSIDDTPGTAPVATVPILVSNSARGGRNTDQQPDPDTPLATPRSERSVASGSRGGGSGGARGKAFVTQTFRGLGRGLQLSSGAATSSASNSVAGSVCSHSGAGTARSRRKGSGGGGGGLVHTRGDGGASSGGGSSGVSFVLKNKRHAAKARRRLTDEQESLVDRFLGDADGYNEHGEPTGDPSGIWAEITPYGGLEAHEDTARLAEIDSQILALRGVLPIVDSNIKDDNAHAKSLDPTAVSADLLQHEITTTPRNTLKGDIAPGEGTLREQRESRHIRNRERAIDVALEQLRDSLFAGSAAGRGSREMAVDAALEQARSAPLSLQMGIRQGAGRVDSLLGGEGPQPVGEWEVKHALRQSEEELWGKDLASCEAIEALLTLVRRDATANAHDAGGNEDRGIIGREREGCDKGDLFRDTNLDAFFVLGDTGATKSPPTKNSLRPRNGRTTHVSVNEMPSFMLVNTASLDGGLRRGDVIPGDGCLSERETIVGKPAGRHGENRSVVTTTSVRDRRRGYLPEEDQETPGNDVHDVRINSNTGAPPPSTTTSPPVVSTSASLAAESGISRQRLRHRTTSKTLPAADSAAREEVAPEVAALFRAPLLAPRVDPPITGIAAAAVASGGGSNGRRKRKPSLAPSRALAAGLG